MIIKQNIQMQQMVDQNNINQLYPYTKAECVIVSDNGASAPIYLDSELTAINSFCQLLDSILSEVVYGE